MSWTAEQILALAPDPSSAKNGQGLATLRKWQNMGRSADVIWGECQGSGAKPYRTQIDRSEPAFKCSCPSRKFPCKHGLGLFLLLAQADFATAEPPDWVQEWLDSRQKRQEQKQAKVEAAAVAIADPEAQAKRQNQRLKKIDGGVAELRQWMADLVRQGLATAQGMGYHEWEQVAARMVDAQAPGLGRRLQAMAGTANSGTGWPERLLAQLGELHLLLESYGRIGDLPEDLPADVRSQFGLTIAQEEIFATGTAIHDRWWVLGQQDTVEERLRLRRIWLRGEQSRRDALVLLFAHGQQPFDWTVLPGTGSDGELVFYPSAYPQRALVKAWGATQGEITTAAIAPQSITGVLGRYAEALGQQPWLERMAVSLSQVRFWAVDDRWYVGDAVGQALAIATNYDRMWDWLALTGGQAIDVTGEWDGRAFYPISGWVNQQFVVV